MYILHLSDLHFGTKNDANRWYNQLATDLHKDLKCNSLDALVLSGDIASNSNPEEYEAAREFIINLMIDFRLRWPEVVIVPGNHDINWKITDWTQSEHAAYTYKAKPLCEPHELQEGYYIDMGSDNIFVQDREKYKQRFTSFQAFYETVTKKRYELEPKQQYTLHHFPDHDLLILGLNSAWQLDHHYTSRASINPDAFSNAMVEIKENSTFKKSRLKIAVWHHPLKSPFEDRITDHGFMEQLAQNGFRLALHGHIHRANKEDFKYRPGSKIDIIAAGTFGTPVKEWVPGYPLQYNLLKWKDNKLTIYARKRLAINGAWQPDAMWTQDQDSLTALSHYEIELWEHQQTEPINGKTPESRPDRLKVHYNRLNRAISTGDLVPFIGTGINLCDRPREMERWQLGSQYPPTDSELSAYLTNVVRTPYREIRCPFYTRHSCEPQSLNQSMLLTCPLFTEQKVMLEEIALQSLSQYADLHEETDLYNTLQAIFETEYLPNRLHRCLIKLSDRMAGKKGSHPLIVTANFDDALENAFKEAKKEYDLVSYIIKPGGGGFIHQEPGGEVHPVTNPNEYKKSLLKDRPVILKLYGGLDQIDDDSNSFVITEDHYINYMACSDISSLIPRQLLRKLRGRNSFIWFLGYSLRYWNLRVILHRIWSEHQYPKIKGSAIQSNPGSIEEDFWRKRKTMFIKMPLEDYFTKLEQQL